MEKKTKKLQLKKETIAMLNGTRMMRIVGGNRCEPPYEEVDMGNGFMECKIVATGIMCADGNSQGCTDGCGTVTHTWWNCTNYKCTVDCTMGDTLKYCDSKYCTSNPCTENL